MTALTCFLIGSLFLAQIDEGPPGAPGSLSVGDEAAASDPVVEAAELTAKIKKGVVPSDGHPVQFWRDQFAFAQADSAGGIFDADVLRAFLAAVQKEGLPDPFRFTPKKELQEAANILGSDGDTELQQLRRELLATELNLASGRSWVASPEQVRRLIRWAESLIAAAETAAKGEDVEPAEIPVSELEREVSIARELMVALNTGGGGGVDE